MGAQESKKPKIPPQQQMSEAEVRRLEAFKKQCERERQREVFMASQIQFLEVKNITTALKRVQNEEVIAAQKKQQEVENFVTQKKLQEEALAAAQKKLQEEAANLAAQKKLQEKEAKRVRQEEAAKRARQEEVAKRVWRGEAARRAQQEEEAERARQEEAAKRAHQEEAAKRARQEEAARRAQQEEEAKRARQEEAAKRARQEEAVRRAQQEEEAKRARQEEAAKRARQEEAVRRAQQEEEAKRARQEEAAKRARQKKMFECENGHGSCHLCKILERECGICQSDLTDRRSYDFNDNHVTKMKVPCLHDRKACEEAMRARQEEAAKRARQEEAVRRAQQEEAARRAQQEEAARRAQQEEAARRAQQEEEAKKARQEEAAKRARQEEATRRAQQEEEAKRVRQEEAAKRAQLTKVHNLPKEADISRWCATCFLRSRMKMFECENGHGSCHLCKILERECGICQSDLTDRRSYDFNDNHVTKMKVPCPHERKGCVLLLRLADMEIHEKECPFKKLDCPLAATHFPKCQWKGETSELWSRFSDMHPKNLLGVSLSQEEVTKRARQEEAVKRARQEEAVRRAQQEEEAKRARHEEAAKRARQEEAAKTARQEEAAKTARQEEAAKRVRPEEVTKGVWREEAARRAQQEEEAKKARQEEAAKRARQEEAAKTARQEEAAKRVRPEEVAKGVWREEAARRAQQEEAARRAQQEEEAKKARQEEAAKRARQEEAARRAQQEEEAKRARQEEAAKRAQQEEAAKRAQLTKVHNVPKEADILRWCATCFLRSTMKMFECENGHGSCHHCKILERECGICQSNLTDRRSYDFNDNLVTKMKVPCPHERKGCVLLLRLADMEIHEKECPFKKLDCPLAATHFPKCQWKGETSELWSHFSDMHPKNLLGFSLVGQEMQVNTIQVTGRRYVRLVKLGYYFIFHLKISEIQNKLFIAVQLIGTKRSAKKWLYEIHVYGKSDKLRKYMYTDHCRSSIDDMDDVFEAGECAVLPMRYANTFFNNGVLTFMFFIEKTTETIGRGAVCHRNQRISDDFEGEKEDNDLSRSNTSLVDDTGYTRQQTRTWRNSELRPTQPQRRKYWSGNFEKL